MHPPPIITAPPPRPRKGRGWMIFAILLLVLLAFSLCGNFVQAISHALQFPRGLAQDFGSGMMGTSGPRLEETVLRNEDSANKVAVVPVEGIITGEAMDQQGNSMVDLIRAELRRARKDIRVKAVILKVNSPGGEVMASDEINRAITKFEEESHKPVICSMGSLAASGGYYISAPCRWIVANRLTITGSIGVILHTWNYRGLLDKIGIRPVTYKSGKYKDMLSGDRETNQIPSGEHAMVQGLIDETYGQFKSVVEAGRASAHARNGDLGRALAGDWQKYADGRVLSGEEALKLGFVDQLGDFDDAVARAEKIAGIGKANLVEYHVKYNLSDFFSMFGQGSRAHDIKLDLGIDLPKLQAGYMYFLSPTYVN
ncbi:MAG: signal peptide peptidase SppA [Verrucomicrobia bacterium]|nr:signal peptide peptidase SppA [Verrucomicrobiota bacterium]